MTSGSDTGRPVPAGLVIALDGPSGTGKSTVARALATRLGIRYLDTGAMYRAATLAVLRAGIDPDDGEQVAKAVQAATIEIGTDPAAATVRLDGTPVDTEIRSAGVTAAVSAVSAVAAVREHLVAVQRDLIAAAPAMVVEGRDIGSVVWPQARPKVFLTASPLVRAQRRAGELGAGVAAVAADLERRDRLDSSRTSSPLVQTDDAVVLDTSELEIDQVIERLVDMVSHEHHD